MNDTLYYILGAGIIAVCIICVYNIDPDQKCGCDKKCTGSNKNNCECDDECECGCKNKQNINKTSTTKQESETIVEKFFGGYRYPYDYPYYWPYFYSGCNETMFGDVKCLPFNANPFW